MAAHAANVNAAKPLDAPLSLHLLIARDTNIVEEGAACGDVIAPAAGLDTRSLSDDGSIETVYPTDSGRRQLALSRR